MKLFKFNKTKLTHKLLMAAICISTSTQTTVDKKDLQHLWQSAKELGGDCYDYVVTASKEATVDAARKLDANLGHTLSKKFIVCCVGSAIIGAALAVAATRLIVSKPYNIFIFTYEDGQKILHHYEAKANNAKVRELIDKLTQFNTQIVKKGSQTIFLDIKNNQDQAEDLYTILKELSFACKETVIIRN